METKFDKFMTYGLLLIIVVLGIMLLLKSCEVSKLQSEQMKPKNDTVYVNKPYKVVEIQTKNITVPITTTVYVHDTLLRAQAEGQDIITNVQFVRERKLDFLSVDKINKQGQIFSSKYDAHQVKQINIDGKGNVEVKKRNFIGLKIGGVVVSLGVTYVAGKYVWQKYIIK